MAFSGGFGQLDLILTLAKTGAKVASSQLEESPVVSSLIDKIAQTASVTAGVGAEVIGGVALFSYITGIITNWIFAALGDGPFSPVDDPTYVKIWYAGEARVNNLKSQAELTDEEIYELAFKVGFTPMISYDRPYYEVNPYGMQESEASPYFYGTQEQWNEWEIEHPKTLLVGGIYAPAEKKYLDAVSYEGGVFGEEIDDGSGIVVGGVSSSGHYQLPWGGPWLGEPTVNINEPVSQSIIQKLGGAIVAEQAQVTSEMTTTDTQFVTSLYQNILKREPDSGGLAYWIDDYIASGRDQTSTLQEFIAGAQYAGETIYSTTLPTTLEAGLLSEIPTWALIAGGGLLLMGFLRGKK